MIIDRLENKDLYPFGPAWNKAFAFLASLTPQTAEGRYAIKGDDIFAIVMCYTTGTPETSLLESHRNYVDIQTVLDGAERFECANREDLSIEVFYDAAKDIELYERKSSRGICADITPGTFIMLYPHDAHMAALMTDDTPKQVKKVVVKVKAGLLEILPKQ
ncbi:MAG: YhcH/YjgK/YiaL family protein [Sulfurovum sp.]|nr:YhcH/YjgK/YiaL family protein [Sulfurovum sp.]MDD3603099.1 YhcH/YjgK/YiaL family protein [Sulfurovum sp.]